MKREQQGRWLVAEVDLWSIECVHTWHGSIVEMVICKSACQKIAKEQIAFNNQDTIN